MREMPVTPDGGVSVHCSSTRSSTEAGRHMLEASGFVVRQPPQTSQYPFTAESHGTSHFQAHIT